MKKFLQIGFLVLLLLVVVFPHITFAQTAADTAKTCKDTITDAGDAICKIGYFLRSLIPLLVALGVVYFVWGVVQYVIGGGEEAKKAGRDRIIWGIIGFAAIAGLWGLVSIVVNTFGLTPSELQIISPTFTSTQFTPSTGNSCSFGGNGNSKLQDLISYVICIIGASIIPLIFAIATLVFLWGVFQFLILGGGEEAKRTQGKQLMIWGIIGLTVMIGVWSLVRIVGKTFNIDSDYLPQVKSQGQ